MQPLRSMLTLALVAAADAAAVATTAAELPQRPLPLRVIKSDDAAISLRPDDAAPAAPPAPRADLAKLQPSFVHQTEAAGILDWLWREDDSTQPAATEPVVLRKAPVRKHRDWAARRAIENERLAAAVLDPATDRAALKAKQLQIERPAGWADAMKQAAIVAKLQHASAFATQAPRSHQPEVVTGLVRQLQADDTTTDDTTNDTDTETETSSTTATTTPITTSGKTTTPYFEFAADVPDTRPMKAGTLDGLNRVVTGHWRDYWTETRDLNTLRAGLINWAKSSAAAETSLATARYPEAYRARHNWNSNHAPSGVKRRQLLADFSWESFEVSTRPTTSGLSAPESSFKRNVFARDTRAEAMSSIESTHPASTTSKVVVSITKSETQTSVTTRESQTTTQGGESETTRRNVFKQQGSASVTLPVNASTASETAVATMTTTAGTTTTIAAITPTATTTETTMTGASTASSAIATTTDMSEATATESTGSGNQIFANLSARDHELIRFALGFEPVTDPADLADVNHLRRFLVNEHIKAMHLEARRREATQAPALMSGVKAATTAKTIPFITPPERGEAASTKRKARNDDYLATKLFDTSPIEPILHPYQVREHVVVWKEAPFNGVQGSDRQYNMRAASAPRANFNWYKDWDPKKLYDTYF